jgi:hypothetical protein
MKAYIHARLSPADRRALERLKRATGRSESALVRRGLELVQAELTAAPTALAAAGDGVGKFTGGPPDLSVNPAHLGDFGR